MRATRTSFSILAAATLLAGVSFALACRLTGLPYFAAADSRSAWDQIFGSASAGLSRDLYEIADRYFHKGVGHHEERAFEDPFQRLGEVVAPHRHEHLSADAGVLEIMPWLSLATSVDPGNIEAYQVAAYWLKTAGHLDEAAELLKKALVDNPDDYRLRMELALLAAARDERDSAAAELDRALNLWPGKLDPADEEARIDLARALHYRALIHQLDGEYSAALPLLKRELEVFPDRGGIEAEIEAIQNNSVEREQLENKWHLLQRDKRELQCEDHHHDHHHDDHHH